jgi:hypothetical protein
MEQGERLGVTDREGDYEVEPNYSISKQICMPQQKHYSGLVSPVM